MVVSMIQFIFELPESQTIKDKRRVINSVRDRLRTKFKLSCAEVDLNDAVRFAQMGAALVSNSKDHGEKVMQNVLAFLENEMYLKMHDAEIHSEIYD